MDDDIFEAEKPKRKYVRKTDNVAEAIVHAANQAIDEAAEKAKAEIVGNDFDAEIDRLVDENPDDDLGVDIDAKPALTFIGQEKVSDSWKAKIGRATGLFCEMEYKPWNKIDHWRCKKCSFTTFKKDRADKHRCE